MMPSRPKSQIKAALKNLTWTYIDRPHNMPLIRNEKAVIQTKTGRKSAAA